MTAPVWRGLLDRAESRAAGLGRLSIWLVAVGFLLQVFSLVQQATHLFMPRPGERGLVVTVIVVVVTLGILGVAAGIVALRSRSGRRTGAFGAALGAAMLALYAIGSWLLWATLAALA